jgi:hypothetical protein
MSRPVSRRSIRRATAADTDVLVSLLDDARGEIGIDANVDLRSPVKRWCTGQVTVEVWVTTDKSGAMVVLNQSTVQYIVVAANRRHPRDRTQAIKTRAELVP